MPTTDKPTEASLIEAAGRAGGSLVIYNPRPPAVCNHSDLVNFEPFGPTTKYLFESDGRCGNARCPGCLKFIKSPQNMAEQDSEACFMELPTPKNGLLYWGCPLFHIGKSTCGVLYCPDCWAGIGKQGRSRRTVVKY